jgi:hypothetical protein
MVYDAFLALKLELNYMNRRHHLQPFFHIPVNKIKNLISLEARQRQE